MNFLSQSSLIIASSFLITSVLAGGTATPHVDPVFMPDLANTPEGDRSLIREIRDSHVYIPGEESELPDVSEELAVHPSDQSVWDIMRESPRMVLEKTPEVIAQKEQYIKDALWMNKILRRATPYLHFFVERLRERNLPLDLALIPAIESGFQAHVSSPGAAAGLWQIVPVTAREIGLKRSTWFDQRADLIHSTRAALDYLSYLNAEFNGDWELTLAAYNAGPGRVRGAIRKNRKLGKATGFWDLKLPQETREYVPKLAALIDLIYQQPTSLLDLPDIRNIPSFKIVDVGRRISFDRAATLANISVSHITKFNAGMIHAVSPPKGPHKLLLPISAVDVFKRNLLQVRTENLYSLPRIHVVSSGESISTIAHRYGISQKQLREMNNLSDHRILIGQKLAVLDIRHTRADTDASTSASAPQTGQQVIHIVHSGDSLSTVAVKYRMSESNLRRANNLKGDKILIGQKLAIIDQRTPTPAATIEYVIKPGDTLSEIAVRFNVRMADISLRGGRSAIDKVLIPGKRLQIKSGS